MEYDCEGNVMIQFDNAGLATADGQLKVYVTDDRGFLVGEAVAQISEGTSLPAHSYTDLPPTAGDNEVVMRSSDGHHWLVLPDYRGQTAYAKDGSGTMEIKEAGEVPDAYTLVKPQTEFDLWDGVMWVTDEVAAHTAAVAKAEACRQQLIDNAMQSIGTIQLKIQMGRALSDKEKWKLNAVLDYTDEVLAIETDSPDNIQWPELHL
ncbi:phage tail protein [Citrobacter sp. CFNIH10]|nr:phage tail protein [Citrobacter sp. CFNIH10]